MYCRLITPEYLAVIIQQNKNASRRAGGVKMYSNVFRFREVQGMSLKIVTLANCNYAVASSRARASCCTVQFLMLS